MADSLTELMALFVSCLFSSSPARAGVISSGVFIDFVHNYLLWKRKYCVLLQPQSVTLWRWIIQQSN